MSVAPAGLRRGQLFVALGALAWSTAGLLQRELTISPATQVAGRAFFATLALLAFVAVSERDIVAAFRRIGVAGVATAACIAVSSGTFVLALNHTSVAHILFINAMAPLAAALLARVTLGEHLEPRSLVAMLVALLGVALMLAGGGQGDSLGDVLAIVMMLTFASALVLTRHRRDVSMAPATCLSQLMVLVVAAPFARPGAAGGADVLYLVLLGAGQIGLGLALLTIGARLIPAAQTALISLLEVVLGPLWVWLAYTEQPNPATLLGGLIVIVAILVQTGHVARRT